jgi:hypothetical protein
MTQIAATSGAEAPGLRLHAQRILNVVFFIFVLCGAVAFIEPSPYDVAALVCIPLWFVCGFRMHWSFWPFAIMLLLYTFAGFLALQPYWHETGPSMFMFQTLYLVITSLFFALFFGERTTQRAELCLKAFTASNVVAAVAAIIGFIDIAGLSSIFMLNSRAQGTFKDPNVFGSFVITGALYCIHLLMLGRTRHVMVTIICLLILITGIFLSFSRGSLLAFLVATSMMVSLTFAATPNRRQRKRILIGACAALGSALLLIAILLSIEPLREFFFQRTQGVGEEYADPRFFNQMRSLPVLLELPLGFGPLRFRDIYGLEPHSSFVNGFASYGWFGGWMFVVMVVTTAFVGFRLCIVSSPYRHFAQVYWPALFSFFMQGFQIDIDHWRHVFLLMGAVWGLESARLRWLDYLHRKEVSQSSQVDRAVAPV